jgi:hypothetical protein
MTKMKTSLILWMAIPIIGLAQEDSVFVEDVYFEDTNTITETFHSTRVINGHSIETLRKGVLEFRVEHRFGDIGGSEGGIQTLYGLDQSSDIRIAFEYGVTDDLMIGFGRSKGTGAPYRSLLDGFAKYKVVHQKKNGSPISIAASASGFFTYMKASENLSDVSYFPNWEHRISYVAQVHFARKFNDRLSLQVSPTLVHRNYVDQDDVNTLFALGGSLRCGITGTTALLIEYYHSFHSEDFRTENTNSLGIAFEWITFGHNFTINLTNSKGFGEAQFITYTFEDWLKGQFRLGFCIGRKFEKNDH